MSYVCRCGNGHKPAPYQKCDKSNCRNCCKGKGGVANDVGMSKTRGVPSMGSTNYGPRGQRQTFRNVTGPGFPPPQSPISTTGLAVGGVFLSILMFAVPLSIAYFIYKKAQK